MSTAADYDPRYLAGVLFFNARDFFEAHEVWEDLWAATAGPERRFYQGLIQAAVALFHFGNRNVRGARRLFESARNYMSECGDQFKGLDVAAFWRQMAECCTELLEGDAPRPDATLRQELIPTLTLDPAPAEWPDPAAFIEQEE